MVAWSEEQIPESEHFTDGTSTGASKNKN